MSNLEELDLHLELNLLIQLSSAIFMKIILHAILMHPTCQPSFGIQLIRSNRNSQIVGLLCPKDSNEILGFPVARSIVSTFICNLK
jgi:hypothetical protein